MKKEKTQEREWGESQNKKEPKMNQYKTNHNKQKKNSFLFFI